MGAQRASFRKYMQTWPLWCRSPRVKATGQSVTNLKFQFYTGRTRIHVVHCKEDKVHIKK